MAIIMLCMHTSRSLKGSTLRQNGHLKSATAAVAETSAPLWVNLAQKLRSSAGSRRRWEQRRVHSGHRRRRQQAVHMSTSLLHPYISQLVSCSGAASWPWLGQLVSAGACAPGIGSAEGCCEMVPSAPGRGAAMARATLGGGGEGVVDLMQALELRLLQRELCNRGTQSCRHGAATGCASRQL